MEKLTVDALINHWDWAGTKGRLNKKTASSMKRACVLMSETLEDSERDDIRGIDQEDVTTRFHHLHGSSFSQSSMRVYESAFKRAIELYLEYLDDPGGWRPKSRIRRSPKPKTDLNKAGGAEGPELGKATLQEKPTILVSRDALNMEDTHRWFGGGEVGLTDYPFPLRAGVIAHLTLPRDLTKKEANRLSAFVNTLVIDEVEVESE